MLIPKSYYDVAEEICKRHGVKLSELQKKPSRNSAAVIIKRDVAMALRSMDHPASYPEIGVVLNRDHTTIMGLLKRGMRKGTVAAPARRLRVA